MVKQQGENHIIQKQTIEINFENISDGFALQNRVADLFYEKLLPGMESLFDEFANDKYLISFDRLDIDCGTLSRQHWEEEWVDETLRNLRRELLAADKIKREAGIAEVEKMQNSFLFFIQKGYLPWNSRIVSMMELEQLVPDKIFLDRLKVFIQTEPRAADRLVYSFSEAFLYKIMQLFTEERKTDFNKIVSILNEQRSRREKKLLQSQILLTLCYDELEITEAFSPSLQQMQQDQYKQEAKIKKTKEPLETESIYIQNAGLVILHPFLQQLFETTGLMKEKQWINIAAQYTATTILQYLVRGTEESVELNPVLNKIICGLDAEEVVIIEEELANATKKECENLLSEVIANWSALKNTGTEALRDTFLQRNGKLSRVYNGWLLQVEQKAVDVLLSRLPWGIGTIKLPWMQDILYTEWA